MNSYKHSAQLDAADILKKYRQQFLFPKTASGQNKIYLCSHSLGLQPITTRDYVNKELQHWADYGVEGHFSGESPWLHYHENVTAGLAKLTGSLAEEVVAMNSLTTNLHLLLISFYQPIKKRYKILVEQGAFPSDRYAIHSQVQLHGYAIEDAVIEIPADENGVLDLKLLKMLSKNMRVN